ncbi:uncharacterized protein LOC111634910 [Centruroides sculpturatus]|uniref:uncharacterized protein LOC111634910 n=1 Tax=Centruroides sculpturatus TaxID=218467 RepID=UPI000C6D685C|nr:uncharacterized protein LOC111634910 [Centruroides sculpturatus]
MSKNDKHDLKVLRVQCEPLTSESEDDPEMDTIEMCSRKRASSGNGSFNSPPASKRKPKATETASVRSKVMTSLRGIISEIQATCLDRENKITKWAAEKVLEHVGALQDLVVELLTEHEKLQGKLEKQAELSISNHSTQLTHSYAEMAKKATPTSGSKAVTPKKRPQKILFVRPEAPGDAKDSDEIKTKFIHAIDPRKEGIRFRQIRKLRTKGLMVQVETDEDARRLLQNNKLKEIGLKTEPLNKRNPRVIIYDVPRNIDDGELPEVIQSMNPEIFVCKDRKHELKPLFKTGKRRDEQVNWVMEVSPELRLKLLGHERLFIDYYSCKVKDYIAVSRCFKCQSFGHVAKFCRDSADTCSHCTEEGHKFSDCPRKKEAAKCAACKMIGKPHNHSRNSKQCTSYKVAIEKYLNTITYE